MSGFARRCSVRRWVCGAELFEMLLPQFRLPEARWIFGSLKELAFAVGAQNKTGKADHILATMATAKGDPQVMIRFGGGARGGAEALAQ